MLPFLCVIGVGPMITKRPQPQNKAVSSRSRWKVINLLSLRKSKPRVLWLDRDSIVEGGKVVMQKDKRITKKNFIVPVENE